jgi:hypothetical protein
MHPEDFDWLYPLMELAAPELVGRYPALRRKNTAFFKATALLYGEMVKAGTPTGLAMELAAQKAEEQLRAS